MRNERRQRTVRLAIATALAVLVSHLWCFPCLARTAVLLLPFTQIDNSTGAQWVGEAVQRSLQSDLTNASASIQLPAQNVRGLVLDDRAAVTRLAHDAGADLIVAGHYQIIDEQIRLTGALLNGKTGETVATLKATGAIKGLFDLEDSIADQIRQGLRSTTVAKRNINTPLPTHEDSGPLRRSIRRPGPIGTVQETYYNHAAQVGRDRYLFQAPTYYGYGWADYGCFFGGGVFDGGFFGGGFGSGTGVVTGGGGSLAW